MARGTVGKALKGKACSQGYDDQPTSSGKGGKQTGRAKNTSKGYGQPSNMVQQADGDQLVQADGRGKGNGRGSWRKLELWMWQPEEDRDRSRSPTVSR